MGSQPYLKHTGYNRIHFTARRNIERKKQNQDFTKSSQYRYRQRMEKNAWERFKDGFKPADVRADEEVKEQRQKSGSQYEQDRQKGTSYVRQQFVKGFYKK